jgi:hypothetical protein
MVISGIPLGAVKHSPRSKPQLCLKIIPTLKNVSLWWIERTLIAKHGKSLTASKKGVLRKTRIPHTLNMSDVKGVLAA